MPKKSNLATSYWEKRRQLEDAARLKMENETIKELTSIFPDALKQIQETLLSQADLHDISLQDLLALPTKRTQEEYRKYIDARYQELMESDDAYQEFIDEFFPAYDYAKVNRLTQIRADIFSIMTAEMMKKDVNQKFNDRLEDILQRSYSSNANALTYLLGGNFHQLPKGELEVMLNYPWTGKTFSQRLWGNVSKLEERLSNAIVDSVGAGKGMRDILATMKNDPQVSALFKREEDKFDNAIENLVRTEYAHFAVEGIKKSFADTGVKKAVSWSAEDERVCSICGGMHGKEVKENESGPPYHGRCRCTLMPKMPELDTAAIDAEYEALFGNTLDEFAKDGFGVKLSHPKKTKTKSRLSAVANSTLKDILGSTNMEKAVGQENFVGFIKNISEMSDLRIRNLFGKLGTKLSFSRLSQGRAYAMGAKINLNQESFSGRNGKNPFETVYHESGHAFDSVGLKVLTGKSKVANGNKIKKKVLGRNVEVDEYITHASSLPQYDLKSKISRDLWKYVNGDLPMFEDLGKKPRKKTEKLKWEEERSRIFDESKKNFSVFVNKYSEIKKVNPEAISALSDIVESTGYVGTHPFGAGHGSKYWNGIGATETEFFAHMTEAYAVNPESLDILIEIFPESVKVWQQLVDDILKGAD